MLTNVAFFLDLLPYIISGSYIQWHSYLKSSGIHHVISYCRQLKIMRMG